MRLVLRVHTRKYMWSALFQYFCIMLCFIVTNTWYYARNDMIFRGLIMMFALLVMFLVPRTREKNLIVIYALFLAVATLLGILFSGISTIKVTFYNWMHLVEGTTIGIIAYKFDEKNFVNRFVKAVTSYAVITLIFYTLCLINAQALIQNGILKKYEMSIMTYTNYYCNFFYAFRDREAWRNVGAFCEPGLYQTILSAAIYLLIYYPERIQIEKKNIALIICLIAIITTQSATGYLAVLILLGGAVISQRNRYNRKIMRLVAGIVIVGIVFLSVDLVAKGTDSLIYSILFEKLIGIGSSKATTGSVRLSMILITLGMIIKNPLGYGYSYVSSAVAAANEDAVGARLFITAAAVGIIPVAIYFKHFIGKAYHNRKSILQFVVLLLLYVNTTLAQSREIYPAFMVLMLLSPPEIASHERKIIRQRG